MTNDEIMAETDPTARDGLKWRKRCNELQNEKIALLTKIGNLEKDISTLTDENRELNAIVDGLEDPDNSSFLDNMPYVKNLFKSDNDDDTLENHARVSEYTMSAIPPNSDNDDMPYVKNLFKSGIVHNLDDFPYSYTTKA